MHLSRSSINFNFIAFITYYNIYYISPNYYFVDTKQVMRESIEKQKKKKKTGNYRSLIRNLSTVTYNFVLQHVYFNGIIINDITDIDYQT